MRRKSPALEPVAVAPAAAEEQVPAPEAPVGLLREILDRRGTRLDGAGPMSITGHLHGIDNEGRVLFRAEGADGPPVPVLIGMEVADVVLVEAARLNQRAIVLSTADAEPRWVLVGLVRERVTVKGRDAIPGRLAVEVDGETVRLTAEQSIELKCGKSSLLLRRDGKIILSGDYIVSASRGPNKIRGATISLN
jgi:hypothetical protein